jgi:hypothetical protein
MNSSTQHHQLKKFQAKKKAGEPTSTPAAESTATSEVTSPTTEPINNRLDAPEPIGDNQTLDSIPTIPQP